MNLRAGHSQIICAERHGPCQEGQSGSITLMEAVFLFSLKTASTSSLVGKINGGLIDCLLGFSGCRAVEREVYL